MGPKGMPRKPSPPASEPRRGVKGKKVGRPTSYRPAFVKKAFELCLLGAGEERIAEHLGISHRELKRWRHQYPRFNEAFISGREGADAKVAGALYLKAAGFERKSERVHVLKDGTVVRVPVVDYYPPDSAALAFYLSNRQREWWRKDPVAPELNLNFSLEKLVLDALALRKANQEKAAKTIEHEASVPPASPKLPAK